MCTLRGSYGRCSRPGLDQGTLSGARHFCRKFSHKTALVRRPCAFRLRTPAQSVGPGVVPMRGISPVNSRIKLVLWDVHIHVDSAGSHKTVVPVLVLAWSCTGPCKKILWRSCWNPQAVLALRSRRCSALVLLWQFFQDPDLVRSSWRFLLDDRLKFSLMSWYEVLMTRHNAASCAKTSSCCWSYDN